MSCVNADFFLLRRELVDILWHYVVSGVGLKATVSFWFFRAATSQPLLLIHHNVCM